MTYKDVVRQQILEKFESDGAESESDKEAEDGDSDSDSEGKKKRKRAELQKQSAELEQLRKKNPADLTPAEEQLLARQGPQNKQTKKNCQVFCISRLNDDIISRRSNEAHNFHDSNM